MWLWDTEMEKAWDNHLEENVHCNYILAARISSIEKWLVSTAGRAIATAVATTIYIHSHIHGHIQNNIHSYHMSFCSSVYIVFTGGSLVVL